MQRLIGLVGFARTGKDTVGDYLVQQHGFTRLASADLLRDVLYGANPYISAVTGARVQDVVDAMGWEYAKTKVPEVRRLLQDLGTEGVRAVLGADTWINETLKRAALIPGPVVITDTRFPNEAELTRAQGGTIWRIDRPGVGPVNAHASERHIMDIKVDHVVPNDSDIEALYARVDAALAADETYPERKTYDPWPGALGERHYTGGPKNVGL